MILVTGASGYVGHHVVRQLVAGGHRVRAMVHSPTKAGVRLADVRDRIEIVPGDVTRPETLAAALAGISAVVHLVAVAIEKGDRTYERVNFEGTVNVVNAAKAAGVRHFVNMSQNGADSRLPYRFLASKGRAQEVVAASGLDWTALCPSVIWGPQDEFANVQARLIKLTPLVFPIVGDGGARFQPVWVGDVVQAVARCLDNEATIGAELGLGGPEVLTYAEIVARVLAALGARRWTVNVPVALLRPAVRVIQAVVPNPPVTTSLLELLKVDNVVEHNALVEVLGITPRAFVPENLGYMREFSTLGTIRRLLGSPVADEKRTGENGS